MIRRSGIAGRVLLAAVLVPLAVAPPAAALEVDQYLSWGVELEDSAAPVNDFLNRGIEAVLARLDRRGGDAEPIACEAIPPRVYRYLYNNLVWSRWSDFVRHDKAIDRFPGREVGYWDYLRASVFRKPAFPFIMPMARSIRIGKVYLGSDKLGHFLGTGRRYYRRYLQARAHGKPPEEAMRRAVRWGIWFEKRLVGGLVDGVFSHADLEANFQGMRLAIDLCDPARGHLMPSVVGGQGGEPGRRVWRLARRVDLRDYVTPDFDETFNPNFYSRYRWKRIRPILVAEYCPRWAAGEVEQRLSAYRDGYTPSFSQREIDRYFGERGHDPRREQALEVICPEQPPGRTTGPGP